MGRKEELDAEMARALEYRLPKSQQGGKSTYTKSNVLGKEDRYEGKAAFKASKQNKKGR